jgi:hypothetical protein
MDLRIVTMSVKDVQADKQTLKKLKMLTRKTTGEQLKFSDNSKDLTILCYNNNNLIGLCNITDKSPNRHFANEQDDNNSNVPYLYNYMCDASYKQKKPSVTIMNFIKNLYNDDLNLDILDDNNHAKQFFEKNNFINMGNYSAGIKVYDMYTFKSDESTENSS